MIMITDEIVVQVGVEMRTISFYDGDVRITIAAPFVVNDEANAKVLFDMVTNLPYMLANFLNDQ